MRTAVFFVAVRTHAPGIACTRVAYHLPYVHGARRA